MITLIYFVLILGVIVLIHEFGHFLFAKLFGVYTYEFSIGMGPKLFSHKPKNSETTYSLRAIPLGGYVAMAGEDDDEEGVPKEKKLYSKKAWQRLIIMAAGAVFNFISATIIIFFIALIWGAPNTSPVITALDEEMPAYQAGIRSGDLVLSVNDKKVSTIDDVSLFIQLQAKEHELSFRVLRDNKEEVIKVLPKKVEVEKETYYQVGVFFESTIRHDLGSKISYTYNKTKSVFKQMYITLSELFTGGVNVKQLSGPVGIYNIVDSQKTVGLKNILFLVALLSINVGVINLLPFPALDGSKIVFVIIEKIKGSPVKQETESLVHLVGFILLISLMLFVTFNDIIKLF